MRVRIPGSRALVLGSALALGACSGEGFGSQSSLTLAVTDAASDELVSFVAEIEAVQLTLAGGAVVSVLPEPIPVDFAALEDLSRVLNVTNVPPGLYSAASVTLDLSNAAVYLVGQSTPATVLDGDGIPITGSLTLPIQFGSSFDALIDRNHLLELDFDLDQSVVVDSAQNEVRVEPALVVRIDRSDPKELGLGGELRGVDETAGHFLIALESPGPSPTLLVTVAVGASTVYQIDGVPALGSTGLAALAVLPDGTWVQAFGAIDPARAEIDALAVEAGTGTYNGGQDIVEGHIVGRVGGAGASPVLQVLGHSNNSSHTVLRFNATFTVSADFLATKVVRRGSAQVFDTDDLNVGQRVRAFGVLTGPNNMNATAASAVIRLQPTRALGFALGAPAGGALTLDLTRVDLRIENAFTWSEGGTTPPDPDALAASVGALGTGLGITAGTPVEAFGFFSAVDDGGADFAAEALVNRARSASLLAIHDRTGGFTVTTTSASDEIRFSIAGASGLAELAIVDQGFIGVMALPSSPEPTIVPANQLGLGYFTLRDRVTGTGTVYLRFSDFASALDSLLAQGAALYNAGAVGTYDAALNSIAVGVVGFVVD